MGPNLGVANLDRDLAMTLVVLATIMLIGLLVLRDLAASSESPAWRSLARSLPLAILPLLLTFFISIGAIVGDFLGLFVSR